jgi:hypothetical protein
VINSLHKTLPVISGCAVLHVNKNSRADVSRLRFFINAMQTTSPSYAMLAQCDFALEKLWAQPEYFEKYVARLKKIREELSPFLCDEVGDPGKLLFSLKKNISAERASEIFAQKYKIQFEMAREQTLLAMTSVADTNEGFEKLKNAVLNESFFERGSTFASQMYRGKTFFSKKVSPEVFKKNEISPTPREAIKKGAMPTVEYPPGIVRP